MRYGATILASVLVTMALGTAPRTNASPQTMPSAAPAREDVLPALLTEVRGLRVAMEQMASAGPRVQLALGRVQLQEQRVNTLMRRIEDERAQLSEVQRKYDQMQQQLRGLDSAIRDPRPEGPPVPELQNMQRETQSEVARLATEIQRLTADSAAMDADLASEQGRWIDLNQRMEALEQSLVRR